MVTCGCAAVTFQTAVFNDELTGVTISYYKCKRTGPLDIHALNRARVGAGLQAGPRADLKIRPYV